MTLREQIARLIDPGLWNDWTEYNSTSPPGTADSLRAAEKAFKPSLALAGKIIKLCEAHLPSPSAWIVEWPVTTHNPVRYWGGGSGQAITPFDAVRFARALDAKAVIKGQGFLAGARAVEHIQGVAMTTVSELRSAWLIELPAMEHDPVRYWEVRKRWVTDPVTATLFARKQDALAVIKSWGIGGDAQAVEHVFEVTP